MRLSVLAFNQSIDYEPGPEARYPMADSDSTDKPEGTAAQLVAAGKGSVVCGKSGVVFHQEEKGFFAKNGLVLFFY